MSKEEKSVGIFSKVRQMVSTKLDAHIEEARSTIAKAAKDQHALESYRNTGKLPFNMHMRTAYTEDPSTKFAQHGYKPKFTLVSDQQKLEIYLKDPIVSSIVQTRKTQVAEFSRPQKDKYSTGFAWERKDNESLTEADKKNIKTLNEYILRTGFVDIERDEAKENMDFETFLKLIIFDRLVYDTVTVELIYDKKGDLHHFLPVSAATMRFAAQNFTTEVFNDFMVNDQIEDTKDWKYLQIIRGKIEAAFTDDDLIMKFGNPTNEVFTQGYSIGELDLLVTIITAHLNADTFNRSVYERGFVSQGIINLKGELEEEQVQALRRSWYNQGSGPGGMNRTPIINTPDGMEFIKLDYSPRDMEYSSYINYLIKIICAVYQIAPEEINFSSGGAGQGGSSEGSDKTYSNVEKRLKLSRDRGLRPILRFIENIINEDILPRLSEDIRDLYRFRFVGLDAETKQDEIARQEKEVKFKKTLNEIRAEDGLDPIEGGDMVLDNVYFQWYSQFSDKASEMMSQGMPPEEFESEEEFQEEEGLPFEQSQEEQRLPFEEEKLPFEKSKKMRKSVNPKLIRVEVYKK